MRLLEIGWSGSPAIISLCNELNFPYCATIDSFVEYWKSLNSEVYQLEISKFINDKLSLEYVKGELVKTAYRTEVNLLTKLDPRVLLIWYSYFAIVPWFIHSHVVLVGYLLFMVFLTYKAKVSPLILGVIGLGLLGEMAILFFISLFFGGKFRNRSPDVLAKH